MAGVYCLGWAEGVHATTDAFGGRHLDELSISIAAVRLGAGKPLFDGSEGASDVEPIRVLRSRFATRITYRVMRRRSSRSG